MDLTTKTLAELKAIAKEKGLKGVTALRKPELAQKIAEVMQEESWKSSRKTEQPAPKSEKAEKADKRPTRRPAAMQYSV